MGSELGDLSQTISTPRLTKYLAARQGDVASALDLYGENTALSEAFYTSLQSLEICLRNSLDRTMQSVYGEQWLLTGAAPLQTHSANAVQEARNKLRPPHDAAQLQDALIAELKFSFWVGLLGPAYDATIWRKCLYRSFLHGGGKRRSEVHSRFNALRRFRNRVAHHEPVFEREVRRNCGGQKCAAGSMR
jgi:hypothetical protein